MTFWLEKKSNESNLTKRSNMIFKAKWIKRQRYNYTDEQKKAIIFEALHRNASVYDTAIHYGIAQPDIYKWCKKLFGIKWSDISLIRNKTSHYFLQKFAAGSAIMAQENNLKINLQSEIVPAFAYDDRATGASFPDPNGNSIQISQ
ncbi:hypothetical protein ABK905_26265 [Acerihabitans sp. KWT182]|uniref:Transposase n=1 Tax=Acerihabitans sp. KWT182 TaxID=3157919 RepID=A0AAU7Q9L3_9GAMM